MCVKMRKKVANMNSKIKEFLNEASLKEILSDERKLKIEQRIKKFTDRLERYKAEGEILKSEFKLASEDFGRMWDDIKSYCVSPLIPRTDDVKNSNLRDTLWDYPYARTGLNKYKREIEKGIKPKNIEWEKESTVSAAEKILVVINELVNLNNELNGLKELVVKQKSSVVAKKESKEQEQAKRANHSDTVKTREFLKEIFKEEESNLVDSFVNINTAKSEKLKEFAESMNYVENGFQSKRQNVNGRVMYVQPRFSKQELMLIANDKEPFESINYSRGIEKLNLASDKEITERIDNLSRKQAKQLIDEYIYRVTDKLGYFFEKKSENGALKNIEKLSIGLMGDIEAKLRIQFHDDSKFDLHTQTIFAMNPVNDGYHIKVQTRFTNAYKPDGTKVKSPSEKRVQDELAM